jgi:uncharacterized beta-barrel protein YwiB (DUF1934 family)
MDKNVIIKVRGKQILDNEIPGTLELITEGKYYKKDNAYYATYNESEVTGMEGTTTTIKIENQIVTLMREGSINSQFVFQKGQRHVSYYDTTYGAFTVGVFANDVDVNVNDCGGEIHVDYCIEINESTGCNDFFILIEEAGYSNDKCTRRNEKKN